MTGASAPWDFAAPDAALDARPGARAAPARILCIGTHHKTGTVWMRRVWKTVAQRQAIPFRHVGRRTGPADLPARGPVICVNWSSRFPGWLWSDPGARFLHVVRDPRDVLLSGMRYHRSAPLGNERFLRRPRADLDGATYQQHLNALPDDTARLLFEMGNRHAQTLAEMLRWPAGHPHAHDLRYEDLIGDAECALFRRSLDRIAPEGLDVAGAVQALWDHALFGGLKRPEARPERITAHVRGAAAAQWRHLLPRGVAEVYAERHGDALERLGYASGRDWVAECPWHPPRLADTVRSPPGTAGIAPSRPAPVARPALLDAQHRWH